MISRAGSAYRLAWPLHRQFTLMRFWCLANPMPALRLRGFALYIIACYPDSYRVFPGVSPDNARYYVNPPLDRSPSCCFLVQPGGCFSCRQLHHFLPALTFCFFRFNALRGFTEYLLESSICKAFSLLVTFPI